MILTSEIIATESGTEAAWRRWSTCVSPVQEKVSVWNNMTVALEAQLLTHTCPMLFCWSSTHSYTSTCCMEEQ